jgi:hypothetical protein
MLRPFLKILTSRWNYTFIKQVFLNRFLRLLFSFYLIFCLNLFFWEDPLLLERILCLTRATLEPTDNKYVFQDIQAILDHSLAREQIRIEAIANLEDGYMEVVVLAKRGYFTLETRDFERMSRLILQVLPYVSWSTVLAFLFVSLFF